MSDITALMATMKAAAEKATQGRWEYFPGNTSIEYNVDSMDEDQGSIVYVDSGDFTQAQTDRNGEFIAVANPAHVLALVEALEKAQQKVDVYDMLREDYGLREKGVGLADFVDWQAKRIAELEPFRAAAEKLVRCKGRYHSEQNYRALATLFGVNTPDLPPLDGESRTVTVKLPPRVDSSNVPFTAHTWNCCLDAVEKCLTAAGIQVIEGDA